MTLDEILASLFGPDHGIAHDGDILSGRAALSDGTVVHVLGLIGGGELGIDQALVLAERVLAIADAPGGQAILFLVDCGSQRMSRRDELLGLSEYLAHLAKSLLLTEEAGHRTIGLLYGGAAAGAFIATALACSILVALPGAHPAVMDLPSMARITKLPLKLLEQKAKSTPVFAPGLDNLVKTGAVAKVLDAGRSLDAQMATLLATPAEGDLRAGWGRERGGRPKAEDIAFQLLSLEVGHG